ncbi:hypothetical protein ACIA59_10735 [Micromonospora haikouensis]|uniref:hypothetical protein n=1 Tax=Micromonospora haikouensis TaxID=686309 RepID=UPI003791C722
MTHHLPPADPAALRPGAILLVDGCASVQFGGDRTMMLRLTSLPDLPTYHGWIWLAGYQLDGRGDAVAKRELYVQRGGLHVQRPAPPAVAPVQRRPVAAGRTRG